VVVRHQLVDWASKWDLRSLVVRFNINSFDMALSQLCVSPHSACDLELLPTVFDAILLM